MSMEYNIQFHLPLYSSKLSSAVIALSGTFKVTHFVSGLYEIGNTLLNLGYRCVAGAYSLLFE
jgi:hypothetical protein